MKNYWVTCSTITHSTCAVLVEAKNEEEAQEIGEEKVLSEDHDVEVESTDVEIVHTNVEKE